MLIDLPQLKKDIENYPGKLHAILLKQNELEICVMALQKSIDTLEGGNESPSLLRRQAMERQRFAYALLHEDSELIGLKRDMGRLRQKVMVTISKDPTVYGLPPRATQKVMDAAVSQDAAVVALQSKIEEREDLLQQKAEELKIVGQNEVGVDPAVVAEELERTQKELETVQKALLEVAAERQVIEEAWPKMYDLLIKMAALERTDTGT